MNGFALISFATLAFATPIHAATQTIVQTNGDPALMGLDLPIVFGQFNVGPFNPGSTDQRIDDGLRISFDPFDPALGRLLEARLDYDLVNGFTGDFFTNSTDPDGDSFINGSWAAEATLGIEWFDGQPGGFTSSSMEVRSNPATAPEERIGLSGSNSERGSSASIALSEFLGGPVIARVTSTFLFQGTNGEFDVFADQFAAVTLTYTYDDDPVPAVPLPATMPLLLAGLGGLTAWGRRRR